MASRYVAGLDFGTTFSGVAFARRSNPDEAFVIHNWPLQEQVAQPYCKTTTALWYVKDTRGTWQARAWGWPAVVGENNTVRAVESGLNSAVSLHSFNSAGPARQSEQSERTVGRLVTRFKLHLSDNDTSSLRGGSLPESVTVEAAIEYYIRGMGQFVLSELRKSFGSHVQMHDIEWALTVPAIWSDRAKQKMRSIAKSAGLTPDGSPAVNIILEPEAASAYCHKKQAVDFQIGDRFLILDAGGGTVDIVVHEKAGYGAEVREVTRSDGGLCGSTYIDDAFFQFLEVKISVLKDYLQTNPEIRTSLMKQWDQLKRNFRGDQNPKIFEVPRKLAAVWKKHVASRRSSNYDEDDFDEIEISFATMKSIFDPTVNKIMQLVQSQLSSAGRCKAILAVGGFSESGYLMLRLREQFSSSVGQIIVPPSPGAAICHGALLQTMQVGKVLSRISRKTYGINSSRIFVAGQDPVSKRFVTSYGEVRCRNNFSIFVKNGETVEMNKSVKQTFSPVEAHQKSMEVNVYSTNLPSPRYVDEPGVVLEGSFVVEMSDTTLGRQREVEVTMYFGRTSIEVKARGTNFGYGEEKSMPIKFEV